MTRLLDVNVLLALGWPNHVHHAPARAWFGANHAAGWATCSVVESGFIRVSSNRRVTPDARTPAEAALLLQRICALPGHAFVADSVSLAHSSDELVACGVTSPLVTDVHLMLLARQASLGFVTFDRAAASMADRLSVDCLLLDGGY